MIKTYEEWFFNSAKNEDLPSVFVDMTKYPNKALDLKATKTVIFDPEDEYGYPNKIMDNTHGLASHAIKHLYEFDPEYYTELIMDAKEILKEYIDNNEMKLIDRRGEIEYDLEEDRDIDRISLYSIINALDFINDKRFKKIALSDIELVLYGDIVEPMRYEYRKMVDHMINNGIRIEDYKPYMGNVPIYFINGRTYHFYDPKTKGLMICTMDKQRVFTLFQIKYARIYDYFKLMKPGSVKSPPSKDIMILLDKYGK